jgi:hypothetical protein
MATIPTKQIAEKKTRSSRGTGTTIKLNFTAYPELLSSIKLEAKREDREPSKFLRRLIVLHSATLFPKAAE